ncbi:MAG: efflux RND transporter permease subunit, partial [Bacteroidales bacterium]|nr:efflux RND transporter permease subunit [Bacteroidales bacterium]
AIVASTITTIVVFIPIVYLHGASGELFREQAFTVAFSLLCSLVVAILIIPMLYSRLYRKRSPFTSTAKRSMQFSRYGSLLGRILDRKGWVLLGALLLISSGWLMLQQTGSEFMPRTEAREFYVDLQMPEGTRLERTMGAVQTVERIIREISNDEVVLLYSEIGPTSGLSSGSGNVFDDQNMATIKVALDKKGTVAASAIITALSEYYEGHTGFTVLFRQEETALQSILGTDESPLVVELRGEEMEELERLTGAVTAKLQQTQGIFNIATSIEGGAPEVEIIIDRYRAGLMNVDVNTLVNHVSERLQGVSAGEMTVRGELTDITLRLEEITLSELERLSVEVNNMEVLLSELAEIRLGTAPREILHSNQGRIVKITADLGEDLPLDQMAERIGLALADIDFPAEYSYQITGEEAMR